MVLLILVLLVLLLLILLLLVLLLILILLILVLLVLLLLVLLLVLVLLVLLLLLDLINQQLGQFRIGARVDILRIRLNRATIVRNRGPQLPDRLLRIFLPKGDRFGIVAVCQIETRLGFKCPIGHCD